MLCRVGVYSHESAPPHVAQSVQQTHGSGARRLVHVHGAEDVHDQIHDQIRGKGARGIPNSVRLFQIRLMMRSMLYDGGDGDGPVHD